jgi:hypothetical protein
MSFKINDLQKKMMIESYQCHPEHPSIPIMFRQLNADAHKKTFAHPTWLVKIIQNVNQFLLGQVQ